MGNAELFFPHVGSIIPIAIVDWRPGMWKITTLGVINF
jgi:hypothetical protein